MRIAYISKSISRSAGGLVDAMLYPAQILSREFDVDVFVFGMEDENIVTDVDVWVPLETVICKVYGPHAIGYSPMIQLRLREYQPDLLHTHGLFYYTSVATCCWAQRNNRPYVVSPHGMLDPWALKNFLWKKKLAGWFFENTHLMGASCIHSLCKSETQAIRRYGLKNNVCQIPNGIDLPDDLVVFEPPWLKSGFEDKKILLYLGRIHPKKGLLNLINAWAKVQKDFNKAQDWILGIAGWDQGGHEDALKKQAKALTTQGSIMFLGPQFDNAKIACYQNASGFILPSFSEGLPMVVLEAWAYGLPVLMTPFCNIPEGFAANAAIKIQPEVQSIEEGLRDFFSFSDQERNQMGQNGVNLVKEKFTWDKVVEDMYSVYKWILGGGAPPSCVVID